MKKTLLRISTLFVLLIISTNTNAQSPGGVGTANLTAWWNPDVLPLGNVTSWTTIYPSGASAITLTDALAPYPIATNTPTGNTSNYNTTIDFAGNGIGNLPAASARALEFLGTLNLLDNRTSTSQGTFVSSYYINDVGTGGQHIVDYRETVGDAIQFRWLSGNVTRMAIGTSGQDTNATRDIPDNGNPMVVTCYGNRSTASSLNVRSRSLDITTKSKSQAGTGGSAGLVVGARRNNSGAYLGSHRSFINELIFFNIDLSLLDLLKVESYLAIKYGTTLDPASTTAGGYLTTNTNIASWTPNPVYHNDVIGIGRDDATTLNQKQSHSFDDLQRIYLGSLSANNAANAATFGTDISYAVMGHNNAALNETALATAEMPSAMNLVNRIEREWCIQNTNLSQTFSVDFTLNNFTNFSSTPSDIVLLVDADGNFADATVHQAGLTFSVNGNTVTVSGISNAQIPLNTTQYITLATKTIPVPVTLLTFEAKANQQNAQLDWATALEENFSHFDIEHSIDAIHWESIGLVNSTGNESNYTFHHIQAPIGLNYYRLKMVDIDKKITFSENKQANILSNSEVKIYPNPVSNKVVTIEADALFLKNIQLYNPLGQAVNDKVELTYLSKNKLQLNVSRLPNGLYFLRSNNRSFSILK